jgi:hypothetical protein
VLSARRRQWKGAGLKKGIMYEKCTRWRELGFLSRSAGGR